MSASRDPIRAKYFPHKVRIALGLAISDVPSSRSGKAVQPSLNGRHGGAGAKLQVSPSSEGEASGRRTGASTKEAKIK